MRIQSLFLACLLPLLIFLFTTSLLCLFHLVFAYFPSFIDQYPMIPMMIITNKFIAYGILMVEGLFIFDFEDLRFVRCGGFVAIGRRKFIAFRHKYRTNNGWDPSSFSFSYSLSCYLTQNVLERILPSSSHYLVLVRACLNSG